MNASRSVLLLCLPLLLVSACEGPVGPEGPPGADGSAGNANVRTVIKNFVQADVTIDGPRGQVRFNVPEITTAVYNSGLVTCFLDVAGAWVALPYTFELDSSNLGFGTEILTIGYQYEAGDLTITYNTTRPELIRIVLPSGRVKAVIIPSAF